MKNNFEIVNDRKVDFYFDGFKDEYLHMEIGNVDRNALFCF